MRRAARHGKLLNIEGAFLCEAAQTVIEESKNAYPELIEKRDYIMKVIRIEEENFDRTINQGLELLNGYLADIEQQQKKELSGEMAFKLYDTFGFPIDLTKEIAEEKGISIDEDGFTEQMKKQKETSRASRDDSAKEAWGDDVFSELPKELKTEFIGYRDGNCESEVKALIADGQIVGFLSLQKFFLLCRISFRLFKAFLLFLFHFKHSCFITFC